MLETTCTLPLSADLFAQALHPSQPVLAVGLSTGHVQTYRLPSLHSSNRNGVMTNGRVHNGHGHGLAAQQDDDDDDADDNASLLSQGLGEIHMQWRTKRHKISCRALSYSVDGQTLYSAGADGIVKAADAESGRVFSKIAVPAVRSKRGSKISSSSVSTGDSGEVQLDACSVMHVLSPQTLLLATDHSSALHIYDLRSQDHGSFSSTTNTNGKSTRPAQTFHPHSEFISSITPLPTSEASTSGFAKQWISTGGTTLAATDLRKGVVAQSEEQDDELTASCFVTGLAKRGTSVGQKAVVGDSSGILTLWERGVWDDMDERIIIDRSLSKPYGHAAGKGVVDEGGESVEVLVNVPRHVSGSTATVAAGLGGGLVAWVQLGPNKVVQEYRHDEVESVLAVGFDVEGRMVSGGGQVVKIWSEQPAEEAEVQEEEDQEAGASEDSDDNSDRESISEDDRPTKKRKRSANAKEGGRSTFGSFKGLD